jgi:hypothetical protein
MFNRMTYADWALLMEGMEARKLWVTVNDGTLESEMDCTERAMKDNVLKKQLEAIKFGDGEDTEDFGMCLS